MSAKPSPGFKKASDSFYQMWWNLKNMNQSPLRGAFYNLIIVIVVAAIAAVCFVLGPFLRPLIWAFLIGAVLFPFKYSLSSTLKHWFHRLESEDTHLLIGLALAPLQALESFGSYLSSQFVKHWHILIGGALSLFSLHLFVAYAPKGILCAIWRNVRWGHTLFTKALSSLDYTIVIAIIIVYLTLVVFLWKSDNSFYFMLLGQTLWIVIVAYCCSFLGALQVPVFLSTLIYAVAGTVYDVNFMDNKQSEALNGSGGVNANNNSSFIAKCINFLDQSLSATETPTTTTSILLPQQADTKNVITITKTTTTIVNNNNPLSNNDDDEDHDKITEEISTEEMNTTDSIITPISRSKMSLNVQISNQRRSDNDFLHGDVQQMEMKTVIKSQSEIYFKALFLACIITIIYKYVWILFFAALPISIYILNNLIETFGLKQYLIQKWNDLTGGIQQWIVTHHSAVLPLCLPGVIHLNNKIHLIVRGAMRDSIDTVSSIVMIILLILTVIFAGVFCAVEIYSETITVVQLGSDVVNWTIYHRPEMMDMFPEGVKDSMDNAIENAYQYGRTGIETYVDELLKDADKEQRKKLKLQVLSIWDRLVQYWVDRQRGSFNGPQVPASAISDSIGEIVYNEELFSAAQQGLIGWVKTNVGLLMEILDSVWLIVKKNLNILSSLIGTMLSMFLGGGHAVISFFVNSIIFLTALFYLLSSSEEKYAPLAATNYLGFASGPRIAEAIEASISSVLIASAKLALFHGLFTWLTHTIFGARVVFLPSVLAAVLAAVPFLGTYWCSIPAFFDLWLMQDRFTLGIILLLIHFLFPTSFVDPAIYADVSGGGHAYLTGLSIAGGMFWLGWEGAIFGPILLCLLVVIFNLTTNALKESPSTPSIRNPIVIGGGGNDYRTTWQQMIGLVQVIKSNFNLYN